jgi:hypothetical protein
MDHVCSFCHAGPRQGARPAGRTSISGLCSVLAAAIRSDSRNRGDVYRVPLINGVYGAPENLGAVNSPDHHDTTPYIAPDQSYMIFSSWGRPDGNGPSGDLYVSFRRNGQWSKPKNIGPLVNTMRTEYCPVVSHDGRYLYFTSERGFADAPLQRQLSSADLNYLLKAPGNGLGDTYRVELSRVWDAVGERP